MRRLCDVPWNELRVGDRLVIADIPEIEGRITKLEDLRKAHNEPDALYVTTNWSSIFRESWQKHSALDNSFHVGRSYKTIMIISPEDPAICSVCTKRLIAIGESMGSDEDGPIYHGTCDDHGKQFYQIAI